MKRYCFFLILIFVFGFGCGFAQDMIITKEGSRIYCRIIDEDSTSIVFIRTAQKNKSLISRSEVETYFASKPPKKKRVAVSDSSGKEELFLLKLNGGIANPIGKFADKYDARDSLAGFAKTGFAFHASAIYKFSPSLGAGIGYRHQSHSFEDEAIVDAYRSANPGTRITTSSTKWLINGFFAGVYYKAPVESVENLSIDFSASVGIPKYVCPELVVTVSSNTGTVTIAQYEGKTRAPTFLGEVGINYKASDLLVINVGLSCMYGKPAFSNILAKGTNGYLSYDSFYQKVCSLNIEAGISFRIFR